MTPGPFVERGRQLSHLSNLLADCMKGRGNVMVISGPVACGRTMLLHRFLDHAADVGCLVLTATASPAEQLLPLGVVDQLLYSASLPAGSADHITSLMELLAEISWQDTLSEVEERQKAQTLRSLYRALLEFAEQSPLIVSVDDVQYTDLLSQYCLTSLMRRIRGSRVMVVLSECIQATSSHQVAYAEFHRPGGHHAIQLEPLTLHGVAQVLAEHSDIFTGSVLADEAYTVTGGNPLLLGALVEDSRRAGKLVVGETFAKAIRSCLHRCDPAAPSVAHAIAVVDEHGDPQMLARLLELPLEAVTRSVSLLNRAGVLDKGKFRHPDVRRAVILGMEPNGHAAMHARAACLTHSSGHTARVVSRHLVHADRVDADWGLRTLLEGAEQALTHGDAEHALACLRAGGTTAVDERCRAALAAMTARIKWRVNPADALPHLPTLIESVGAGHLDVDLAVVPVQQLLWQGQVEQATELLEVLLEDVTSTLEAAESLSSTVLLLAFAFPASMDTARRLWQRLARTSDVFTAETPSVLAARALIGVLRKGANEETIAAAERVLHGIRLTEGTLVPAVVALSTLLLAEQVDAMSTWCNSLISEAEAAGAPTWRGLLLALRAESLMLQGQVAGAETDALAALKTISANGCAVAANSVFATLIAAATQAGGHDVAARYLVMVADPSLLCTPCGLRYVYARGTHYLGTGRIRAASTDFQFCGDALVRYGLDQPTLVPWRSGLAQVSISKGGNGRARELLAEQLRLLGTEQQRTRGITHRLIALASDPKQRPKLLREAIELLKHSGDWLEVARSFADLSNALNDIGEANRARLAMRTARAIAKQCQAHELLRSLHPEGVPSGTDAPAAIESPTAELSEAERRVAALAGLGHTNREIAGMLYVTMSTVEQHLTRVYRKLGVTRRTDLPPNLNAGVTVAT